MEVTMREETLSIAELQKELPKLPEQFEKDLQMVTVTRSGKPIMTILPAHTYKALKKTIEKLQTKVDGLVETMEILQDEETMAALRRGIEDIEAGRTIPWADVKKELGLK
jgi:PHD/YefM family antitoxin component YafN of YafNO toxin-antitoxin module